MPNEMDDYAKSLDGLNADDLGLEDQFSDPVTMEFVLTGRIAIDHEDLEDNDMIPWARKAVKEVLEAYVTVNGQKYVSLSSANVVSGWNQYDFKATLCIDLESETVNTEKQILPVKIDEVSKVTPVNGEFIWSYDDGRISLQGPI